MTKKLRTTKHTGAGFSRRTYATSWVFADSVRYQKVNKDGQTETVTEKFTANDLRLLQRLQALADNRETDFAYYDNREDLAHKCGMNEDKFRRQIARLIRFGLVKSDYVGYRICSREESESILSSESTTKLGGSAQVVGNDVELTPQETAPQETPSADVPPEPKALEASTAPVFNPEPVIMERERKRREQVEMAMFQEWLDLPGDPREYWEKKEEYGYENYKNRNSKPVSTTPVSEAQEDYLDDDDW